MKPSCLRILLAIIGATGAALAADPPPNILFILADDAGFHDFGFQNNPAFAELTPHLDRLRRGGASFTNAYASASMCGPSRAGLLTGRYQQRFGFEQNYPEADSKLFAPTWQTDRWKPMGLDLKEKTVADHLKANGYATAIIGKWHLGYDDPFHPNRRGFDEFFGIRGGSRPYFSTPELETAAPPKRYDRIEHNDRWVPESQITYTTDDFARATGDFLKATPAAKPFFVYLSFTAPHTPLEPKPEDIAWVRSRLPDAQEKRILNLALIRAMDRNIGLVLDQLAASGRDKNTIIVFTVDNGGSIRGLADNSPWRGYKFSPFEGGIHVPLIVDWPGVTKPDQVVATPVILLDFAPTFVAAAGGRTADGARPFDGVNLLPLLQGEPMSHRLLFWREINSQGLAKTVIDGPLKLITYENKPPELYDLFADPGERDNLAPQRQDIVTRLQGAFAEWASEMESPRWYQN